MNNRLNKGVVCLALLSFIAIAIPAFAQNLPSSTVLVPANPTSADAIKLSLKDTTCGGINRYLGNPYRVSMVQNAITVSLGEKTPIGVPLCPAAPQEEIDLGRLPAGNYTLTVNHYAPPGTGPFPVFTNYAFMVTDARANKADKFVRLDYSGHWWDPNDSGWGLFIWQDARSPTDSLLAAWFTYSADGKPNWYVFQPAWQTSTATQTAPLANSTRLPGATSPPPTAGTPSAVGTASLDFTNFGTADEGKITYTFTGGQTLTRTIKRFQP